MRVSGFRKIPPLLEHVRALRGSNGERLSRAAMASAAFFAVAFVLVLVLLPARERDITRVHLPERYREIVIPEPEPAPPEPAPVAAAAQPLTIEHVVTRPDPEPEPEPVVEEPRAGRREARPALDPNQGLAGRRRAAEATADLAHATRSLDGLDQALGALSSDAGEPRPVPRIRRLRSGRSEAELASYDAGAAASGVANDLDRSRVQSSAVAIGTIAPAAPEDTPPPSAGSPAAARPGVYRSNASLLAVVQRYSAGIQYCYGNELKRDPSLEGRLVVAITVAASGRVLDVRVVQNTVRSERLAPCALSQIANWRFPPIAEGVTAFQAPFVFTPPR